MVIGCAALYPFPARKGAELACLAVNGDYRNAGYGDRLLAAIESQARREGIRKLFVLTTRAAHWFVERGFQEVAPEGLPMEKRALYNYQRRSKVFVKKLR